jgi:hypothetical protein
MNAVALVLKYCAGHLEKEERNQGVNINFRFKVSEDSWNIFHALTGLKVANFVLLIL